MPQPTTVAHSYPGHRWEQIDVGGPGYRSSSAADSEGGRQVFEGEPSLHEEDVQQVCDTLREALAQVGDSWDRFCIQPETSDVDAVAEDGHGGRLQIQVTRVERDAWREAAQTGRAESIETYERRAAAIWNAIAKKSKKIPPKQRAQLVLALDVIRTPDYLRNTVIEAFRAHYGDQAASLGYIAIWLVGPGVDWTHRLS